MFKKFVLISMLGMITSGLAGALEQHIDRFDWLDNAKHEFRLIESRLFNAYYPLTWDEIIAHRQAEGWRLVDIMHIDLPVTYPIDQPIWEHDNFWLFIWEK